MCLIIKFNLSVCPDDPAGTIDNNKGALNEETKNYGDLDHSRCAANNG